MEFDDFISNRAAGPRGRGQGRGWRRALGGSFRGRGSSGQGPLRVTTRPSSYSVAKQSFSRAKDMMWKHDLFNDSMTAMGLSGVETGTKLYISNLDFGVSNEDIKELFSEVGHLKHSAVHYDRNGRPSGSAEVIFTRRSDAATAVKRYNNVRLDGRPMKIEVIGTKLGLPISPRVNVVGGTKGRGKRTVVMTPDFGHGASFKPASRPDFGRGASFKPVSRWNKRGSLRGKGRGRVNGEGQGRGRVNSRGKGEKRNLAKSADELDMELDKYHAEAKP